MSDLIMQIKIKKRIYKKKITGLIILLVGVIIIFNSCSGKKENATQTEIVTLQNETESITDIIDNSNNQIADKQALHLASDAQFITEISAINLNKYLDFEPMYTWSEIKILGWSSDSKIAYSDKKYMDGRGGIITTVVIFDLVNDKILWENALDSEDYGGYDDNIIYDNAFNNFIMNFIDICGINKIEFLKTEFLKSPIIHNNQTVNITVDKKEKSDDDWEEDMSSIFGNIGSYKIIAENQIGKKIIHEKSFRLAAVNVVVCGYFISPFEDRALIVIGEYVRVFEGCDIEYKFIGCHLSNGFR